VSDRLATANDRASQVDLAASQDEPVELGQVGDLGHRDQMVAAEPADLSLDAALGPRRRLHPVGRVRS
jgi:hypothetical protein